MTHRRTVTRRGTSGEAGQGIAYVLIVSAVLLVLLIALVDALWNESKFLVMLGRKRETFHAADGAIDRALYALQQGGNWDAIPKHAIPGYNQDVVYTDVPQHHYTLLVQEGNWTPGFMINDPDAYRTITVFMTASVTGEHKKIQAVVLKTSINSALFSGGNVSLGGSCDINWGPVVSYSTAANSLVVNTVSHPVYISKGGITNVGGMVDSSDPYAGLRYNAYATDAELGPQPVVPTNDLRSIAKAQGTYYGYTTGPCADSPGTIPTTNDTSVIFYDTCTGVDFDPKVNSACGGSCGGTTIGQSVKFTGGCGSGTFIVMGDLEMKGNGTCTDITMTPPADCARYDSTGTTCPPNVVTSSKLFWNGFIYVAGALVGAGTKMIYGSLYAYDTAGVSGNWSLYYKSDNKSLGYLGKSVFVNLWLERAPKPGESYPP